jgi:hypothetical protein
MAEAACAHVRARGISSRWAARALAASCSSTACAMPRLLSASLAGRPGAAGSGEVVRKGPGRRVLSPGGRLVFGDDVGRHAAAVLDVDQRSGRFHSLRRPGRTGRCPQPRRRRCRRCRGSRARAPEGLRPDRARSAPGPGQPGQAGAAAGRLVPHQHGATAGSPVVLAPMRAAAVLLSLVAAHHRAGNDPSGECLTGKAARGRERG